MSTVSKLKNDLIGKENERLFSKTRVTIETAFYGNNVERVFTREECYLLAKNSPGTIVTDLNVYCGEKIGLPSDAKVLIFNDGGKTARNAKVRQVIGNPGVNENELTEILREAIFKSREKKMYHASALIGLDGDFMVRANLLIPKNWENNMYSWMLNFQEMNEKYLEMYRNSKYLENEGDIYIFSDPDWSDSRYPDGLTIFDPLHNVVALLGMRYFGEHKKGTLSLAWGIATRNGYLACHGGLKEYSNIKGKDDSYSAVFFGLSGSGKSTLTHAKHSGKYGVKILHDDALIISRENGSAIALEPSYFDKTQDYKLIDESSKYLLTMQNCGVTINEMNEVVPVMEDIRNGNGRAIKSEFWSANRVNRVDKKCDGLFWIMKDDTLPPLVKINDKVLATIFGAALATKRSNAEIQSKDVNLDELVFEPFANPFRTYSLETDFNAFLDLIEKQNLECYIINTGFFRGKKIGVKETLECIESVIEKRGTFSNFGDTNVLEYLEIEGYTPNFNDSDYKEDLKKRLNMRVNFLKSLKDMNKLPEETIKKMEDFVNEICKNG